LRREGAIDAGADAEVAGERQPVVEEVAVTGRDHAAGDTRIREGRIGDVHLELVDAVDAERLLIGAGVEPLIEDAGAAAERGPAALGRRPGEAETRAEVVVVVHVRLRLVAQART